MSKDWIIPGLTTREAREKNRIYVHFDVPIRDWVDKTIEEKDALALAHLRQLTREQQVVLDMYTVEWEVMQDYDIKAGRATVRVSAQVVA